ncbi:MAG: UPF0758 domain-containing protein [Pseudomonadota bacterium]
MRDRAAISFAAVPDYELLELILTRGLRRGDVKPTAKALLARFGGLAGVFGAGLEELTAIKGVGPSLALDLKLLHEATVRIGRGEVKKRTVISSWSALLAYTRVAMAHEAREQFRVLFLDKKTNQASRGVRAGPGIPSRQRLVGCDASLRVQARSIQSNLLVG